METSPSDASGAKTTATPPHAPQASQYVPPHAPHAAHPPQDLEFTLTVAEARERFAVLGRHVPAERTVQNYCVQGGIAAQKIRTTYGSEWIINAASLDAFIRTQPEAPHATQAPQDVPPQAPHAVVPEVPQPPPSDADTPPSAGDTRTLGAVLLENARVLERLEGREQLLAERERMITELRDDRSFLREELKEARKTQGDVKTIAQRMLETLETMALGGRLLRTMPREQGEWADGDNQKM